MTYNLKADAKRLAELTARTGALQVTPDPDALGPANTGEGPRFADPRLELVKGLGNGAKPTGTPHRIIPSLWAMGTYQGVKDPVKATGITYAVLDRMSQLHLVRVAINARIRQARAFCQRPRSRSDVGFVIEPKDPNTPMTPQLREEIEAITQIIEWGGIPYARVTDHQIARWDGNGEEKAVRFDQLVALMVEDSLVYDAAAFRKEFPRVVREHPAYQANPEAIGYGSPYPPVWLGPLAGHRLRSAEPTYRDPQEVAELERRAGGRLLPVDSVRPEAYTAEIRPELGQHVAWVELDDRGQICREFAAHEVAYLARNPRSDQWTTGYGRSELEYLIELVTGLAAGVSFNVEYFTHSHIPAGFLFLKGGWKQERLEQFRQQIVQGVGGPGQYHKLPLLFSEDPEALAQFLSVRNDADLGMFWEKWISWLVNAICAAFGMAAEEIGFQSFRQSGAGALTEADPTTRILQGQDVGFVPLMSFIENWLNETVIWPIDRNLALRWQNLHERDESRELADIQTRLNLGMLTVNQALAERNEPEIKDPLDLDLYRRIEVRAVKQWPVLQGDVAERTRVTRQIYEHLMDERGKSPYARWPDAPGIVVPQVYMQEMGAALGGGPGGPGGPGGVEGLMGGGLGLPGFGAEEDKETTEARDALGPGGDAAGGSLRGGAGPSGEGGYPGPADLDELKAAFMPPEVRKSVAGDDRDREAAVLRRVLARLGGWAATLRDRLRALTGGGEGR